MTRRKEDEDDPYIQIGYTDRQSVKQKLLVIAAKQGHGSMVKVIRGAVKNYLKNNYRKGIAKTG